LLALALICFVTASAAAQVRIKDVTDIDGARSNQLYGFGLVVGLDGTGSRSAFTQQVAVDMLQKQNVTTTIFSSAPSDAVIRSTSISAVMVTAELGPFHRKGGRIDVTISALDDAKSLQGGTLVMTPLRGADGQTYVVAQGPISIGGFSVSGQGAGAGAQKNHLNVGRIANGGMVEKEALGEVFCRGKTRLLLKEPDFNTARLMAKAVNEKYPGYAQAVDGGAVAVGLPPEKTTDPIAFITEIGLMEVTPDMPARVVINERTGTVVAGENVTISATAVSHGNLYLFASEPAVVSQPPPFSGGQTTVVTRPQIGAVEQRPKLNLIPKTTTVADLARALNALGVSPRDLISIFQTLKKVGALHAEIVVM
jgi:flagellar P-ring protein FlgI